MLERRRVFLTLKELECLPFLRQVTAIYLAMRKNNWWDHLFNNHHYDFAYAYADPVIEDKKEEEEELFKQFFELRLGRFFRKVTKTVGKAVGGVVKGVSKAVDKTINVVKQPAQYAVNKAIAGVKDVTGVTAAENAAKKAQKEAEAEAKRATDEYNKTAADINKNIKEREAAYKRQTEEGKAKVSAAQSTASAAAASREKASKEGKAKVAYATKQREATISKIQQQKLRDAAAAKAKAKLVKTKSAGQPGIAGTVVKSVSGLGGTGKTGSAKGKTKGVKDKAGKLLIG
jgi:hypothetical protein